jgi:hypothetical protein
MESKVKTYFYIKWHVSRYCVFVYFSDRFLDHVAEVSRSSALSKFDDVPYSDCEMQSTEEAFIKSCHSGMGTQRVHSEDDIQEVSGIMKLY